MKRFLFFIMMLTIVSINANSIFSSKKFPVTTSFADVYSMGAGGAGIADVYRVNSGFGNPALMATCNKVTFSTAVSLGKIKYKDYMDNSYTDDGLEMPYFSIIVPIKNHRIGFNYNSSSGGDLENQSDLTMGGYNLTEIQKINSFIYNVDLKYAYKFGQTNIGLQAKYFIGHYTKYIEQDYEDEEMVSFKNELYNEYKSVAFTFGITKKFQRLSLGFSYTTPTELKGNAEYKYSVTAITEDLEDSSFEIPHTFIFGSVYKLNARIKTMFDINYEMWSKTDNSYNDPQDVYSFKLGLTYDPLWGYGKWYEKIPFRTGFYYKRLPFMVNGNHVTETGVTLGFSIPLKRQYQKIDFAVDFKKRGDVNDNKLEDNAIFFSIGYDGFDIFRKRTKRTSRREIPKAD